MKIRIGCGVLSVGRWFGLLIGRRGRGEMVGEKLALGRGEGDGGGDLRRRCRRR